MIAAPGERTQATTRRSGVLAGGAIAAVAVVGSAAWLYAHNPYQEAIGFPCPVLATTGFYCPGCGATRATYSLLHGDVIGSLGANPLVLIALVPLVAWGVAAIARPQGGLSKFSLQRPGLWVTVILGAIAAFTVLRNTPMFAPYLAP